MYSDNVDIYIGYTRYRSAMIFKIPFIAAVLFIRFYCIVFLVIKLVESFHIRERTHVVVCEK